MSTATTIFWAAYDVDRIFEGIRLILFRVRASGTGMLLTDERNGGSTLQSTCPNRAITPLISYAALMFYKCPMKSRIVIVHRLCFIWRHEILPWVVHITPLMPRRHVLSRWGHIPPTVLPLLLVTIIRIRIHLHSLL